MKQLVIIGASGHGKVVADIAVQNGYDSILFLDDDASLTECGGYPVVGASSRFKEFDCDMCVAIGNGTIREWLLERLETEQKSLPVLIHPDAVVARQVNVGAGTVVMAGAVVNPGSVIGKGCIINTCASVDHDCRVGDYTHISVGARLAGTVTTGKAVWVGIGAVVSNNLQVADGSMIGAGAVVVRDITEAGIYIGVPAKRKI